MKLAKMNLAVNGLRGELKQINACPEDAFDAFGNFDHVRAKRRFNVDDVPLVRRQSFAGWYRRRGALRTMIEQALYS